MRATLPMLNKLGLYLVTQGYLDKQKALSALQESGNKKLPFISYLAQAHYVNAIVLAQALSQYFDLPFVDLDSYELNQLPLASLTPELILKHHVLPIAKKAGQLTLAVADPTLPDINELNFLTGMNCSLAIVAADKLQIIIDGLYSKKVRKDLENNIKLAKDSEHIDLPTISSQESPIVKLLNNILLDAIAHNASDIHFEPYENDYRVRFRIDGILYDMQQQPKNLASYFTARLKILANLDISERRVPQDGRFKIQFSSQRTIDFRLSTCPTLYGEKTALRILQSKATLLDIHALGMNQEQTHLLNAALAHSQGMILVTGPTGSGKTITLYAALDKLNTQKVNIVTIEDPIEIPMRGINQVQINPKAGLYFATALRAFLRQDPDIIMVGEIRDQETAEIAIKAAQTGHLVLSTLHTNSAVESLIRLANMGVATYNIGSAIILIIAQRLLRCLCPYCKKKLQIPACILLAEGFNQEELSTLTLYQAQGCQQCIDGYQGRTGIYEVLSISDEMANLIVQNASTVALASQASKEKIMTLRQSGLQKVKDGITSLDELNRIIV
jgi:type IV pilus assembly protein PilB